MKKLAPLLARFAGCVLGITALAAVGSGVLLATKGLREDYAIASFVARDDPAYLRFEHFLKLFVSNEMGIVAVTSADALAPEALAPLGGLAEQIRRLPHVEQVTSLTDVPYVDPSRGLVGSAVAMLRGGGRVGNLSLADPERRDAVRAGLLANPLVSENLLSKDGKTAAILIQTAGEQEGGRRRKQLVDALREVTASYRRDHPDQTIVLAGPLVTLIDLFDALHRDLLVFSVVVAGMILVMLAYVFRRPIPVLGAVFVAAAGTLITLGLSILLGISMSLLTQVLVILITINTVATCVHLIVAKWEIEQADPTLSNRESTRLMLERMIAPCAVVSLTTAAGFGALRVSDLKPFQDFSVLMVFGILLALVIALSVAALPSGRRTRAGDERDPRHEALAGRLETLAGWTSRHRWVVVAIFVGTTAALAVKIPSLRFESDFVKNFRAGSEVRRNYRYISERLSPVGSMEVVIASATGQEVLTPEVLRKSRQLGEQVVARYDVVKKAMGLDQVFSAAGLGLGSTRLQPNVQLPLLRRFLGDSLIDSFVTRDGKTLRINLRAIEATGAYEKLEVADGVAATAAELFGPDYRVEVTGLYPFYARLIVGLLRDQMWSFAVAAATVFVVMWIGFRSLVVTVLAMIPNLLPMVFCLGVMGWMQIPVNMGTAMILSVAFGIAVDNTVHYLWRYRRELMSHGDEFRAMVAAHRSVGRACVFTTVVLVGGFWILCLSEFMPTVYFGALVGLTMLGALGADLILWPLILTTVRPIRVERVANVSGETAKG